MNKYIFVPIKFFFFSSAVYKKKLFYFCAYWGTELFGLFCVAIKWHMPSTFLNLTGVY